MFCGNCGNEVDNKAVVCVKCGVAVAGATPPPPKPNVSNHLVGAILVTVLCCLPFGIVSIIYATQVNTKLAAGDIEGTITSSKRAKTWMWWGFGVGLAVNIIVGVLQFGLVAAAGS